MSTPTLVPRAGMIVLYAITAEQIKPIIAERKTAAAQRRFSDSRGNQLTPGDEYPMLITKAWGDSPGAAVNGTVFLDGPNETLWVTSASEGEGEGHFRFQDQVEALVEAEEEAQNEDEDAGNTADASNNGETEGSPKPKTKSKKKR